MAKSMQAKGGRGCPVRFVEREQRGEHQGHPYSGLIQSQTSGHCSLYSQILRLFPHSLCESYIAYSLL